MARPSPIPQPDGPEDTAPRALRSVRAEAQLGFDETIVEDAVLEAALEGRLARKVAADYARKAFDEAAELATVEIAKLELEDDTAVRCGRFRITRKSVAARSVAFEAKATSRITITLLDDD